MVRLFLGLILASASSFACTGSNVFLGEDLGEETNRLVIELASTDYKIRENAIQKLSAVEGDLKPLVHTLVLGANRGILTMSLKDRFYHVNYENGRDVVLPGCGWWGGMGYGYYGGFYAQDSEKKTEVNLRPSKDAAKEVLRSLAERAVSPMIEVYLTELGPDPREMVLDILGDFSQRTRGDSKGDKAREFLSLVQLARISGDHRIQIEIHDPELKKLADQLISREKY